MGIIVLANFVFFFDDAANYNSYIDQTVTAMKAGDNETLYSLRPPRALRSGFFPAEGTIVSDYSVSWIYEYYVIGGGR